MSDLMGYVRRHSLYSTHDTLKICVSAQALERVIAREKDGGRYYDLHVDLHKLRLVVNGEKEVAPVLAFNEKPERTFEGSTEKDDQAEEELKDSEAEILDARDENEILRNFIIRHWPKEERPKHMGGNDEEVASGLGALFG